MLHRLTGTIDREYCSIDISKTESALCNFREIVEVTLRLLK